MDDEKLRQQLRALEAQKQALEAQLKAREIHTDGGHHIGTVNTDGGDFVGRDQVAGNVYYGDPPQSPEEAEAIYRQVLANRCGDLPLRGIDPDSSDATKIQNPLGLAQVYIDLNTRESVAVDEGEQRRRRGKAIEDFLPHGESRPLSVLEAVIRAPRLVLLGDPGSGKTTFVNHLAQALALRDFKHLLDWPEGERDHLPILIILRDLASWLKTHAAGRKPSAGLLWQYIAHDLSERRLAFVLPLLQDALDAKRSVMLLDGLDEVSPVGVVAQIQASIVAFVKRYPEVRALATCRVLSYQQAKWQLPNSLFNTAELAPFAERQIKAFIEAWYAEIGRAWNEPPTRTASLKRRVFNQHLIDRILQRLNQSAALDKFSPEYVDLCHYGTIDQVAA